MEKSHILRAVCIAVALAGVAATADASPLRLDYQITNLGGGSYQYDFDLVLDNNDGSWSSGQEFDWFVFGDRTGVGQPSQFGSDWVFSSIEPGWTGTPTFGSAHEGPSVCFNASCGVVTDPNWIPSALGESVSWSGTSSTLISNSLSWSYLTVAGGASPASYLVANPIPIPPAVWLFGSGLLGMIGMARRRKAA